LIAVSLTVAAVPEGLPVALTITLALGMRRMIKRGAYIRNLRSVETLGSASVICSDKTGTLTKGAMTAVRVWYDYNIWKISGTGYDPVGHFTKLENGVESKESEPESKHPYSLVLIAGALSSNSRMQQRDVTDPSGKVVKVWEATGNSSEKPLVVAAAKAGLDADKIASQYPRVKENPFNSQRKMMSVFLHNAQDSAFPTQAKRLSVAKGAPNVVLEKCLSIVNFDGTVRELTEDDRTKILDQIDKFSESAFRVLAIAFRPFEHEPHDLNPETLESNLTLIGLIASIDPEREEVIPSIDQCYDAGIRVVMITGDYVKTARAIAINIKLLPGDAPPEASIDCGVIREWGDELSTIRARFKDKDTKLSSAEKKELEEREKILQEKVDSVTKTADVYARAKPVDKITIVESLQRQGNVCSMTGDGVNDAPALKQANIGVAMGITGTAVAKGASDMILTNDDFCSIVSAVEEGRTIYANITKFVYYLLSCNIAEVFFILVAVLIGYQTPLAPIQILYLNLTTDVAPALALAVEAVIFLSCNLI
jgi:Ca2+-transporting ATPase